MSLHAYGLLIGKITGFREPRGREPHWLLMVQPGNPHHPPYRVAVDAPTSQPDDDSEIEYQVVHLSEKLPLVVSLRKYLKRDPAGTPSFLLANAEGASFPRLDYQEDDFVIDGKFPSEKTKEPKVGAGRESHKQDVGPLQEALGAAAEGNAMVAVFGTGAPMDHRSGVGAATGYTGVENVHMNQGAFNRTNGTLHYLENGRRQDGGLVVLAPDRATGIFIKFRSQTLRTDERGYPGLTGIAKIDAVPAGIRKAIMPPIPGDPQTQRGNPHSAGAAAAPAAAVGTPAAANAQGYVFADFDPDDASGQYIPDNDANTYQTPIVQDQSKGHTRGPVPVPRDYPLMTLAGVTGNNPPGYSVAADGTESIAFDIIGDSGAPTVQHMNEFETKVADLLARDAAASQPAFMFHVGDVVYFYGEKEYYYSQFYDPFRAYPAPIFAIPGNHDGCIYDPSQVSLADFQSAFCAQQPGRWVGAGGILRSAMTQPGVYFTLDAPLVSIIGLYTNCGESFGWLDEQQLTFLYNELVRLQKEKQKGPRAVILAVHHFPRWFPSQKPKDPTSTAIDAACSKAGLWPDAVICGHAHLYQRVVRQNVGSHKHDVPYILSGAGGYGMTPSEEVGKSYMQQIGAQSKPNAMGGVVFESGYVRATISRPARGNATLNFEYRSVKPKSSQPDDTCTLDLVTNRIVQ